MSLQTGEHELQQNFDRSRYLRSEGQAPVSSGKLLGKFSRSRDGCQATERKTVTQIYTGCGRGMMGYQDRGPPQA
jgi:hypothetical protein